MSMAQWGRGKRASATTTWGPRLLRLLHITSLACSPLARWARPDSTWFWAVPITPSFPAPALARQRKTPITRDPPPSSIITVPFRSPPFSRRLTPRRDPGLPRRATPPPPASLPRSRRPAPCPTRRRMQVRQVHAEHIRCGGEFRARARHGAPPGNSTAYRRRRT